MTMPTFYLWAIPASLAVLFALALMSRKPAHASPLGNGAPMAHRLARPLYTGFMVTMGAALALAFLASIPWLLFALGVAIAWPH